MMSRLLLLLLITVVPCCGQSKSRPPSKAQIKKLIKKYLSSSDEGIAALELALAKVPPLSAKDAKSWKKEMTKALHKSKGPRLEKSGTGWFYEKGKRGKYIVQAGGKKGLIIGLHGGGVGSADCTGAASSFGATIKSMGMIGIFPQAIEATEAAWGDDVTVKFVFDLLAAARRTWKFDPDHVYVCGHSMGGYGTWTLGGRFSDRFAGAAAFAGAPTPIMSGNSYSGVQVGVTPNFMNLPIWQYHSVDDPRVDIGTARVAIEAMKDHRAAWPKHYQYVYKEVTNRGHAFPAKGPKPALSWMTKFKRQKAPRRIAWEAFYDDQSDSRYWLHVNGTSQGSEATGTFDGKNHFDVSGSYERSQLTVLLDDDFVDLDKPIKVSYDDAVVFEGKVERSLLTMLQTLRSKSDPGLIFSARIPLQAKK